MISYIDEAGSFVSMGASENSWCAVACYSIPDFEKRKLTGILRSLKQKKGVSVYSEVKLKDFSQREYLDFISQLTELNGSLFGVATDSYYNSIEAINAHKELLLESIYSGKREMKFEGGKEAMRILHSQISILPEQLYVQFHCQSILLSAFIKRGVAYYVQRFPNSLKNFSWRYDAKEIIKITDFEDSFLKLVPALLQAYSIKDPSPLLDWCDYSTMKDYMRTVPDYLVEKFPELEGKKSFDSQKIVRGDIEFVDSKSSPGVQVADLLSSGLRRLLKLGFDNNEEVARAMGRLFLQESGNRPPITLVAFDGKYPVNQQLAQVIKILNKNCRKILK